MNKGTAAFDASYACALRALRAGQPAHAEQQLLDLLARRPDEVICRRLLGLALLAQDKLDAAVENLERAIALAPDFAHACTDLARAYRRAGRPQEALVKLKQVLV